jgi:hypothetical protein
MHTDGDGLATSTQLLTGKKYWVVFYRDPSLPNGDPRGDLGGIAYSQSRSKFDDHDLDGSFVAEAVVLNPGDVLYVSSF